MLGVQTRSDANTEADMGVVSTDGDCDADADAATSAATIESSSAHRCQVLGGHLGNVLPQPAATTTATATATMSGEYSGRAPTAATTETATDGGGGGLCAAVSVLSHDRWRPLSSGDSTFRGGLLSQRGIGQSAMMWTCRQIPRVYAIHELQCFGIL